ncbi:MAG TPA: rhodanese-like domain-containing protein, partial [Gemmatimonadaceae bacterium]|nr:rhodanese-like domain-containing protein [Gemmatimonadaceae bacterium]
MRTLLISAALLPALVAIATAQPRPRTIAADFVVSTSWVAAHQQDGGVALVHVVQDSMYDGEHIPGSRVVWYRDIVTRRGTVGSELPSVEQLRAVLERRGISRETRVIVYAPEAPMATRF